MRQRYPFRPLTSRRDLADSQAGSVRKQERRGRSRAIELGEHPALDVEVLRYSLEHDLDIGRRTLKISRRRQPVNDGRNVGGLNASGRHQVMRVGRGFGDGQVGPTRLRVVDGDIESAARGLQGNPVAHAARADHGGARKGAARSVRHMCTALAFIRVQPISPYPPAIYCPLFSNDST